MGIKIRRIKGKKIKVKDGIVVNKKLWGKTIVTTKKRKKTQHWSKERDRVRKAKKAGWRVSKRGRIYYENRVNRSDVKRL